MRKPIPPHLLVQFDRRFLRRQRLKTGQLAGLDEAGRGPLAGPVVAAAVILTKFRFSVLIDDSKKLSPRQRETAYRQIRSSAHVGVGWVGPETIDRIGIHAATHTAMRLALTHLPKAPAHVLIDGLHVMKNPPFPATAVVDGDAKSLSIACASIVAKVLRDRLMVELDRLIPAYGFLQHKGYGTEKHLSALRAVGPTWLHRFSFAPIR